MPNQRRAGQIFIGCQADEQLVADLDRARGHKERSQFIREAIAEKLQRAGIRVAEELIYAPPRAKVIKIGGGSQLVEATNIKGPITYSKKVKYTKGKGREKRRRKKGLDK